MTQLAPRAVRVDEVPPVTWAGNESGRFLLRAEHTGGAFSYYQVEVPAGHGTVLHSHDAMDETFHVIGGDFEITVGEAVHHAGPGTVIYGPRGVQHAFRNRGGDIGTLHCITTPGGIETFFEELSDLLHEDPPAPWSRMSSLATAHGIVAVDPTTVNEPEEQEQS